MRRTWLPAIVYALAHFAVDFGCAYAIFAAYHGGPLGFLFYNFFAFAVQMPLGLLADSLNRNRLIAFLGTGLVFAVCCHSTFGLLGCIILGLGNAMFHIGGGLDVMNLSGSSAAPLGVFVSPGAYGVFLGTILGNRTAGVFPVLAALLLAAAGILLMNPKSLPNNVPVDVPARRVLPVAALLFLVVILRSYGGMSGTFPWKSGLWSVAAVSAVVLGKTAGGFLADWLGTFRTAALSLLAAAALFLFSAAPIPGVVALFLFNMTMPITLFVLARNMPGCKGFSFGILTFALFLGFLPTYFGIGTMSGTGMAGIAALSALLLLPALQRRKAVKP